ncbi:MAG: hypothetical protein O2856_00640, partial [Planctomycetota bacterium]|nr:hypothetical protein [Planctomycetota bacterium]
MPRFDDSDDEFYSSDDDVYADLDGNSECDDDDEPTIRCPHCGFERLEIVYQCPRCGEIPTQEFRQSSTQPRWVIFTALILLGILLWSIFIR